MAQRTITTPTQTGKCLLELRDDNKQLASILRQVHDVCDKYGHVATVSLIDNLIDETERRTWFLFETTRNRLGANV